MTKQHEFAVNLAKTGHDAKRIIELVEQAFPGQGLKKTAVYEIIKRVKEGGDTDDNRGKGRANPVRTDDFIQAIREDVEKDRRVSVRTLAERHFISPYTALKVLRDDLGLPGGSPNS